VSDTSPLMGGIVQCEEKVWEPPGYTHSHRCPNKATWLVTTAHDTEQRYRCGVHVKWFERHRPAFTITPQTGRPT